MFFLVSGKADAWSEKSPGLEAENRSIRKRKISLGKQHFQVAVFSFQGVY